MRMKTKPFLIWAISLGALIGVQQAGNAKEFSQKHVIEYIKVAYEVGDATDKIQETLMQEGLEGIRYFTRVKAVMVTDRAYIEGDNGS